MSTKKMFVKDLIIKKTNIPIMRENSLLKEALEAMSKYKYGVCFCINRKGKLLGILTDGDLRRAIKSIKMDDKVLSIMKNKPITAASDLLISSAVVLMNKNSITSLIIANKNVPIGIVNLKKCIDNE